MYMSDNKERCLVKCLPKESRPWLTGREDGLCLSEVSKTQIKRKQNGGTGDSICCIKQWFSTKGDFCPTRDAGQ